MYQAVVRTITYGIKGAAKEQYFLLKGGEGRDGGGGVGGVEDVAAGNEYVGSGIDKLSAGVEVYAAVNLDKSLRAGFFYQPAQAAGLVKYLRDEFLPSETGVDAHKQNHIDIGNDVAQEFNRGGGVECHGGFHSGGTDGLNGAMEVCAGFPMDIHGLDSDFGEGVNPFVGFEYHQVGIKRLAGNFSYGFDYRETEGNVRYELTVHDVKVNHGGGGIIDHFNVGGEIAEIRA